jgi:F-type H+-transporting ATPase subunit b
MTVVVLLAAVESGGRVQELASTFGVDWPHLVAQVISFCIVCALLYRFAYNPVLKMLEQRREQIAKGLADAQKIKDELARTKAKRQEILLKADEEANKLIEEARIAAARVQMQETQKATAMAEQIVVKAREAAEQEHARMLAELKRHVGQLVVQTTATVTGKILTSEDQRRMAEETVKQLAVAA